MITTTKILAVLMAALLLTSGVIYAQEAEENMGEQNGTEMMEEVQYRAGILDLETLLEMDPALKELAEEYQTKLAEITETDSETQEAEIQDLKTEYTALSINQTKIDFADFAEEYGLDILVINETAVYNPKELAPENITEFQNMRTYFKSYLDNQSQTAETNDTENSEE